ncbi:MAG: HPr(Ser) kinase/phosphatase [Oscillospiraceae bacterium]|nr:HPr(Ser) kinase/phosphatase [Oscillospiraceae bacterium]
MTEKYKVSLARLIKEFDLAPIYLHESEDEIFISTPEVNRPGLHLCGFYEYFQPYRIQCIGRMEAAFLKSLDDKTRAERVDSLFAHNVPAVVDTSNLPLIHELEESAERHRIPLLKAQDNTSTFMSALISFLSVELAPRVTRHGVLVEVYGEGMLILGESGVGKSETAIELVKRGHRLIADDAVEIRRVSNRTLVGSSPENIRHFVELRGIGIINAMRLFGMGAVKLTEKIDLVVHLEVWDNDKTYDRMGMDDEYTTILDIEVPAITIPVKPGRNLAIILEVASMNSRQKKLGHNAAHELLNSLGFATDIVNDECNWDN